MTAQIGIYGLFANEEHEYALEGGRIVGLDVGGVRAKSKRCMCSRYIIK